MRRRKDPALLEQEGWRLFRVRVFPIPARDVVRIRLRYAYVLPDDLRGQELHLEPLAHLDDALQVAARDDRLAELEVLLLELRDAREQPLVLGAQVHERDVARPAVAEEVDR